jgi:ribonuclease G
MTKELVIASNRHETRVAVLEDDQLVEIYFQRQDEYSLAGSIHKGRVTRVLPGMQSAFVDLGLERDTFLYVSDFFEENEEIERLDDRSPRQDRPVAVLPPPPPPPQTASVAAEESAAPAAESVAPTEAIPAAEQSERENGDGRDRRGGRRSRRRRGRGRGFPESKYASPDAAPAGTAAEAEELVEARPRSGDEFFVLPGESLAKYSGPEPEPEQESESLVAEAVEIDELPADITVLSKDEPEEHPPTNAIPDAPAHHAEPENGTFLASVADEQEAPEPPLMAAAEEDAPRAGEAEELALQEPETDQAGQEPGGDELTAAPGPDEDDREIQQMILEAGAGAESEIEAAGTGPAAGSEETGPTLASVRDQGGRYLHRMSRRMRRRMRGGENQPSRTEQRPEPPRVERIEHRAEHKPAPRPEPPPARVDKDRSPQQSITDLLKEGQEILVQIAKEPLGQKGARITSHIALPGRYVVYMPTLDHMGVSRKIASDDERLRLKKILQKHRAGIQGGFIIRTAGEGRSEEDIAADMNFLGNLWLDIRQKAERRKAPVLLHHDLDIVQRLLRDQLNEHFKSIWVDSEEMYENILKFVQRVQPGLVTRVKMYTRPAPIFDAFGITSELEKALRPKVWLKSGGYIVINQTEALVAIDINTGKFIGKSNRLEDTIVKTNTEAIKEIVRQVRLRDLGGIIVIDFIDMDERKNRQKVMQTLEEAMRADRAPYKILQFNDFGLVAITRKRVKQSLERALCEPCPYCEGAAYVKSVGTVISEILTEAQKIAKAVEGPEVLLRVHPDVAKVLKSTSNHYLEELEETLKRPVLVTGDGTLHREKFDLA